MAEAKGTTVNKALEAAAEVLIGTLGISPDSPPFVRLAAVVVAAYLDALNPADVAEQRLRDVPLYHDEHTTAAVIAAIRPT